ncbi:capsule assembly Wzi family protein [Robiginitalea aurantiaca]|uniref:Capsule assembly Wzi family protein n=1 Tax=Robiginitalea aurantiaca TaxID=3056915 RepID=A0ABT7WDZ2_9FLAO|nr:capsule assembly Wzi family protein [Robiginitalea aurantiaca]MDM9631130.1 capsule assembly Wzi family protein [Robiginitalea aurantiaca]
MLKTHNKFNSVSTLFSGFCFLILISTTGLSAQYELQADLYLKGFINNGSNPFWEYSNTLGMVSEDTEVLAMANGYYRRYLSQTTEIEIGASLFTDLYSGGNNKVSGNEYYASFIWETFRITGGARARPERYMGISSVNGNIVWSNNARPMPGVEIQTLEPLQVFPWLGLEGNLAHFWLNNDRYVTGAYVHYKNLTLNFTLSDVSTLRAGIEHFAQWGGISPESGSQSAGFGDYWKVFFGLRGDEGTQEDVIAIGNHVGSYQLEYSHELNNGSLTGYIQTIWDDVSGVSLQNLADGVFGVFWELPDYSALRGLVYEYVQTTYQSGPQGITNGNDDYFNHNVYRSGWTYKDRVVGLPYFTTADGLPPIINTRIIAHHLGARIQSFDEKWDLRLMGSYTINKGRYDAPFNPEENVFYAHARVFYALRETMQLGFSIGTDVSSVKQDNFGIGLSFRYMIGERFRMDVFDGQ